MDAQTLTTVVNRSVAEINKEINALKLERYETLRLSNPSKETLAAERKAAQKQLTTTANGLTIENLRKAGFCVKVVHIRYVDIPGCPVPVPINMLDKGHYTLNGKGGTCHVFIEDKEGESLAVTSVCHHVDNYFYKYGVKLALDQIDPREATYMLDNSRMAPPELIAVITAEKEAEILAWNTKLANKAQQRLDRYKATLG